MITLYGIKNCDTCAKARKWLDAEGIAHRFFDVRRDGLDANIIAAWATALGWEPLINRRGTTWRNLSDAHKACFAEEAVDAVARAALVLANPTLVKRPVFDLGGEFRAGFKEADKASIRSRLERIRIDADHQSCESDGFQ